MPSLAQSPEQHLAQLSKARSTLSRTRQAIPSLVASVSAPLAPLDRASLYRAASAECHAAIRQLAEELEQLKDVLQEAEDSERKDSQGIVVRPLSERERPAANKGADPWERVGEILGGAVGSTDPKGKGKQPYLPRFDNPASPQVLADLARRWHADHPRVRIELLGPPDVEQRQMTVTLRGVLHAVVKLRWEGDDAGSRSCEADWACIYSLKEDRPPYLPSRFSLFQSLTNEAMDILDRCRRLRVDGDERTASVEELLIRLCHSEMPEPLPALICLTFGSFHRLASDVLVQSLLVRLTGKLIKCCVDGLKRTFHRVRCSRPVDYQGARYSIGFFDRARRDAVIQGPAVAYPPITGGELIAHAMQRKLEAAQAKAKGKAYEVSQTKRVKRCRGLGWRRSGRWLKLTSRWRRR